MNPLLFLLLTFVPINIPVTHVQAAHSSRTTRERIYTAPVKTVTAPTPVTVSPTPTSVTAAPTPTVTASAPTQSDFRSQVEQYVFEETNAARARNGLGALNADAKVASVARAHSADMLAKNYFEHTNLSGCNAGCRLTNAGYVWRSYGENIHWMSGYNLSARDSAKKIVTDWMNSPGHRANILGSFTYAGVGIAVEGSTIYSTTDYTTK